LMSTAAILKLVPHAQSGRVISHCSPATFNSNLRTKPVLGQVDAMIMKHCGLRGCQGRVRFKFVHGQQTSVEQVHSAEGKKADRSLKCDGNLIVHAS
jgi:hypothetical protein